jgi:hypothetical protein
MWISPFSGKRIYNASDIDIDHVVPQNGLGYMALILGQNIKGSGLQMTYRTC